MKHASQGKTTRLKLDDSSLRALHIYCLSKYDEYQQFYTSWQQYQCARQQRSPVFDDFQAWDPSDDEIAALGYSRNHIRHMLGGPNPQLGRSAKKAIFDGRTLRSTNLTSKSGLEFQRSVVEVKCIDATGLVYLEYGLPFRFVEIQPFVNVDLVVLAQCRFFSWNHGHSGPRQRNWMRGSDLKIVSDLCLREGDQFTDINAIQHSRLTLNPRRSCDVGCDNGSWILLHFADSRDSLIGSEDSEDE